MAEVERTQLLERISAHIPLAATGAIFALVFLKLFAVSHGNYSTFSALLTSASAPDVTFSTVALLMPGLGFLILIIGFHQLPLTGPTHAVVTMLVVGVGVTLLTAPAPFGQATLIALPLYGLVAFYEKGNTDDSRS